MVKTVGVEPVTTGISAPIDQPLINIPRLLLRLRITILGRLNQPTELAHFLGLLLFALKPVRASVMTNIDRPKKRATNTTLQTELLDTPD